MKGYDVWRMKQSPQFSTGMTNAGIGIVRISGEDAFAAADKIFRGKVKISDCRSHTIHYGNIVDGDDVLDEVHVMVMKGPRTFTGEDYGGNQLPRGHLCSEKKSLDAVLKCGVRPAQPGEFTKRAFLNGKLDLSAGGGGVRSYFIQQ